MNRLQSALQLARIRLNLAKLKRDFDDHLDQPEELVSLLFQFAGSSLKPLQIKEELAWLVQQVRTLKPRTVLEIGTARGGTLFLWTRLARPDAVIVSIDLPGGRFGGGYNPRRGSVYHHFPRSGQQLHLLREDSHQDSTLDKTRALFGGELIDFLFIDGDHTYEGVKKDWEMYSPLVRPGGLIAFHDIAGNYEDTQVKRLWDSVKPAFEHREYAVDPQGYYGIGVLVAHP